MSDTRLDDLDYDELEEMHAALRDHMLASDLVEGSLNDPELVRETVASMIAVIRHHSDAMRRIALVVRRQPAHADHWAQHLEELADGLDGLVGVEQPTDDEDVNEDV